MIQLVGSLFILIALICACVQGFLPLLGYYRNNTFLTALARPSAFAQSFFVLIAYILLTYAFVTNDFSIAYVALNSHPNLPFMYRLTAVWGAHEGSILLWIVMLNVWTLAFILSQKRDIAGALVTAILGLISFCFLAFLFFTSNPFLPATELISGQDLNPLLQDPGFVIHPPMLYLGYVGFSVAFAITQAALIRNALDETWAKVTRQFAIAAWCFLTAGIALGSWWAYRVLGWGGFWFWDPVENASLLPWLSGTALIHVLLLVEKRQTAKAWAALLALICFALSLLGTFLVRSGVLISAHTFASDPARGVFLLVLLGILLTLAMVFYLIRLPGINSTPINFHFVSRETSLLINSLLLFVAMLTVLFGTLYPLILDALNLGTISVGAPYFNFVMMPLVLITMFFMGLAALSEWQHQSINALWLLSSKRILLSIVAAVVLIWSLTQTLNVMAILSLSLSIWVILSLNRHFRTSPGMAFAHLGFAVLIIGILLSSLLSEEREVRMQPGQAATVGPYQFFFLNTEGTNGSNYRGIKANFDVLKNTRHIVTLAPEKRIYTVRDMVMTKVDIHPGIFRDLYIALGEPLENETWSVRIYYKPFMRWIWFGAFLMIIGGILAMRERHSKKFLRKSHAHK